MATRLMKKYNVILADPPWHYKNQATRASADKHYPTMKMEEIKALPVKDLAAMPCALFLWATWPNMPLAFELLDAWHFEFKTLAFDWIKTDQAGKKFVIGLGNYSRSNPEPCLLAFKKKITRGAIMKVADKSVPALITAPRRKHSQKPDEVYNRIERLYPIVPKIELFATQRWPNWDVWGLDVESDIVLTPKTRLL